MAKLCLSIILIFCKLVVIATGSKNLSACWMPMKYFNNCDTEPHGLEPYRNDLKTNQPVYAARRTCPMEWDSNCNSNIIKVYPAEMKDFNAHKDIQVLTYPPGSMSWTNIKTTPNHGMPLIVGGSKRKNKFLCRYRSTKQRLVIGSYLQGDSSCILKYQGRTIKRNTFETLVINLYGKALGLEHKVSSCHSHKYPGALPSPPENTQTDPEKNGRDEDENTKNIEDDDQSTERDEEEEGIFNHDSVEHPCWYELESSDTDNHKGDKSLGVQIGNDIYLARLLWPHDGSTTFGTYLPSQRKIQAIGRGKSNGKQVAQILILPNDYGKWLRTNQKTIRQRGLPASALIVGRHDGNPFHLQTRKIYYAVCNPAIPRFGRGKKEAPVGVMNSEEGLCAVWFGGQLVYFTEFYILTSANIFYEDGHEGEISSCNRPGKLAAPIIRSNLGDAAHTRTNSHSQGNRVKLYDDDGWSNDVIGQDDDASARSNHDSTSAYGNRGSRTNSRTRNHQRTGRVHNPKNVSNSKGLNYHSEEST